jgi:hypothetical protein
MTEPAWMETRIVAYENLLIYSSTPDKVSQQHRGYTPDMSFHLCTSIDNTSD